METYIYDFNNDCINETDDRIFDYLDIYEGIHLEMRFLAGFIILLILSSIYINYLYIRIRFETRKDSDEVCV